MTFFVQVIIYGPRLFCIALGWNHDSRPVFLNIRKDILRAIGLIAEQVAASNIRLLQEFDGVSRIIVIARREQKGNRIPQPIQMAWIFVFRPPFVRPTALFSVFFPTIGAFVDFHTSRINTEILSISILTQLSKNFLPYAIIPPLGKTSVNALPRAVAFWKLSPLRSAVIHPQHTVQHRPVVFPWASFLPTVFQCIVL